MYDVNNDYQEFASHCAYKDQLKNKCFLITGGTGLIGKSITKCLLALDIPLQIVLPVRNKEKAEAIYGDEKKVEFVACDLQDYLDNLDGHFDYIIHCASPTAGKYMTEHPVETYQLAVDSTKAILQFVRKSLVESFVYISSLEYYGEVHENIKITENMMGYIAPNSARSSYPMGKKAAEYFCYAYAEEYNVPVKIARLTQTFGPGIAKTDNRVFAQFARAAINSEDIVLKSSGESSTPYCYVTDAVSGILAILLKGSNGEVYNVANEDTFISINDMAKLVKDNFNSKIEIIHDLDSNSGYAPDTILNLSVGKMRELGWKPKYDLKTMYKNLIEYLRP